MTGAAERVISPILDRFESWATVHIQAKTPTSQGRSAEVQGYRAHANQQLCSVVQRRTQSCSPSFSAFVAGSVIEPLSPHLGSIRGLLASPSDQSNTYVQWVSFANRQTEGCGRLGWLCVDRVNPVGGIPCQLHRAPSHTVPTPNEIHTRRTDNETTFQRRRYMRVACQRIVNRRTVSRWIRRVFRL